MDGAWTANKSTLAKIKALEHPNLAIWDRRLSHSPLSPSLLSHIGGLPHFPYNEQQMNRGPCQLVNYQQRDTNNQALQQRTRMIAQQQNLCHQIMQRLLPQNLEDWNEPFAQLSSQYQNSTTNVTLTAPHGDPPALAPSPTQRSPVQDPKIRNQPLQASRMSKLPAHLSPIPSPNMSQDGESQPGFRSRISSSNLTAIAQRAALRNGSGDFGLSARSPSTTDLQPPLDPTGTLALAHPRTQNNTTTLFTYERPPSRSSRSTRAREIQQVLGFNTGLDSNMPSQIPRDARESDLAARQHALRVRSMQRTLASDPNVMVPRAPGAPTQLTAIGPPLTGQDPRTATKLPSVLNLVTHQPKLTYQQGFQAIFGETGSLLLRLTQLEPRAVSCVLYGPSNQLLTVTEDMNLDKDCDIKKLVTGVQALVDEACKNTPVTEGTRFIVTLIEVRVGASDGTHAYPPLKGVCTPDHTKYSAGWVKWATHGDMEKYWEAYRCMLQTQSPYHDSVKPIFKVTCVKQIKQEDRRNPYASGHEFYDVSNTAASKVEVREHDTEDLKDTFGTNDGSVDIGRRAATGTGSSRTGSFEQTLAGEATSNGLVLYKQLQFDGAASNSDSQPEAVHDGSPAPSAKTSEPREEDKAMKTKPAQNWGYFQRMGGNPKMHKLYDLSHVPFDIDAEDPRRQILQLDDPESFSNVNNALTEQSVENSELAKALDGVPEWDYIEEAIRKVSQRQHEAAINFEDDDTFCHDAKPRLLTQNDIHCSRMTGQSKPKDKGKTKEKNQDTLLVMFNSNTSKASKKNALPYLGPDVREFVLNPLHPGSMTFTSGTTGEYPVVRVSSTMNVHATPFTNPTSEQGPGMLSSYYPAQSDSQIDLQQSRASSARSFEAPTRKSPSPLGFNAEQLKRFGFTSGGLLQRSRNASPDKQRRQKSPVRRKRSLDKPVIEFGHPPLPKPFAQQSFDAKSGSVQAQSSFSFGPLLSQVQNTSAADTGRGYSHKHQHQLHFQNTDFEFGGTGRETPGSQNGSGLSYNPGAGQYSSNQGGSSSIGANSQYNGNTFSRLGVNKSTGS